MMNPTQNRQTAGSNKRWWVVVGSEARLYVMDILATAGRSPLMARREAGKHAAEAFFRSCFRSLTGRASSALLAS